MLLRKIWPFNRRRSSELKAAHQLRYRFGYIRDGKRHLVTPWQSNLILDSGLNKMGTTRVADCWQFCLFGNQVGPTPVRRNSGAVTFTVTGTACVAAGGFFTAQDVGRLIKFNGVGGEYYITAFTDSTHVTLSAIPNPAVIAETATVWYVNQTSLESLYAATNTYGATGGDNGQSVTGNTVTAQRTFVGAAIVGSVTLTEIGFSNSASNTNIFDRDIITGGIGLINGDIPIAICQVITTYTPNSSTPAGNVGTGLDTSGDMIISGLSALSGEVISLVQTNGVSAGAAVFEPYNSQGLSPITTTFTLPGFSNGAGPTLTGPYNNNVTLAGYSNGTFFRDCSITYGISEANGLIYGFGMIYSAGFNACWMQKFTAPVLKLNTQTLTMTTRKSWQRILVN